MLYETNETAPWVQLSTTTAAGLYCPLSFLGSILVIEWMYVSDQAWLAVTSCPIPQASGVMHHFPSISSTESHFQEVFKEQACRSGVWRVASLPHQEETEDTAKGAAYRKNNKCAGGG